MNGPTDPILRRGRLSLGETDDAYAIWVRGRSEPIESFPMTEDGFDRAEVRLVELHRAARRQRRTIPRVLWTTVVAGAVLWAGAGVPIAVFAFDPLGSLVAQLLWAADALGYRGLVVGTFGLVAWRAVNGEPPRVLRGEVERDPVARRLRVAALVGLIVWAMSGAAEKLLRPTILPPSFGTDIEASPTYTAILMADIVAFRVWIGAVVAIGIRWLFGGARPAA